MRRWRAYSSDSRFALISMLHHWSEATDGTAAHVKVALLDYKKAFYLVDHSLLIAKLYSLKVKSTVVNWVADFLQSIYQRVKLKSDCLSDFKPQGTGIGPWLFLVMINDLTTSNVLSSMWKFADDTAVPEIVPKFGNSSKWAVWVVFFFFQKHAKNDSTGTVELFCAKNRWKQHRIFEKWDHFQNRPFCKVYSPCKMGSLGWNFFSKTM